MRKSIAAAVIAASAATSACGHSREEDGGPAAARNFPVGAFTEIEAAGPYDVTVTTGSAPSVSAKGPQKVLDHMVVEVAGGKLRPFGRHVKPAVGRQAREHRCREADCGATAPRTDVQHGVQSATSRAPRPSMPVTQ